VETLLTDNTIEQVCGYATWAYNSSYDLVSQAEEVEYMRTSICPGYYSDINTAFAQIDATNQGLLSTGIVSMLSTTIHTSYVKPSNSTKRMTQRQVLDEGHLFAIASATSATELSSAQLGAASTLVFEVYSDNSVVGKLND
jgi:hypothetical protein